MGLRAPSLFKIQTKMKKKGRCPHCGKFVSSDVMEKLSLQAMVKKLESDLKEVKEKSVDFTELLLAKDKITNERNALLKSNRLLEDELIRLRKRNISLEEDLTLTEREMKRLHNRGLLARLLDK